MPGNLPGVTTAIHDEVLATVSRDRRFGLGSGPVDAHLLTAVRLTPDTGPWTKDRRWAAAAARSEVERHPNG